MYNIIQKRKIWLTISGILVAISVVSLGIWGLKLGIDFTGGSLLEVEFTNDRPAVNDVQLAMADLNLGSTVIQPIGEKAMVLRFQDVTEEKHQEALDKLNQLGADEEASENVGIVELRYDAVGPTIGQELKTKSINAMIVILIAIVLYIAWAFRKVSKPVASYKYGFAATIALFHDVIITMGVFAVLGKFYSVEVNAPFVAAILTVLGYSVNDTIVVFDRIRENLPKSDDDFETTVNTSINQTLRRSLNTSFTTILVLLAILFFGGSSISSFVLALTIGIFIGTYSSIFLASPILVLWQKMMK